MNPLESLARLVLISTATLALASACGGNSFSGSGGDGGDSGSSGTGATSNDGGKASAGNTGSGGKATGGSSSAGGSGPAGGSGGSSPGGEACNAPPSSGNCEAYFESWYHDPATGLCRPFVYGGCGGNANRYESFEACQKACPGGVPNYDACKQPTDCTIAGVGCCGVCDGPNITSRDVLAYNREFQQQVSLCAGDVACAPCAPVAPGQGSLKYFVPDCVDGQCAVVDLRTSPTTACETEQECRLRNGTSCCEGCVGGGDVIAVRNDGSFEKLVCGSEPQPCPACIALPQPDAVAACIDGHCQAVYAVSTN